MLRTIQTTNAPAAIGPYSQAVRAGNLMFVSGQIPLDPESGQIKAVDITGQTTQVMENIKAILEAEGLSFRNVARTTIYLTDLSDFGRVNEVYAGYFEDSPPARTTVQVSGLPKGAKVEIEAIAVVD